MAAFAGGCGEGDDYANEPRPPAPINITASISDERVSVSPESFGAGPVVLVVTNQSDRAQTVTLETDELSGKPGVRQSTSPISPQGTGTLKVDIEDEGAYVIRTGDDGIDPATVRVGPRRESAQNELLQP